MPLSFVAGVLFYGCHQKTAVKLETFHMGTGWGYQIKKNNHIYIRQDNIPVIQGNYAFETRQDAKKTGLLVLEKLNHHQFPTITRQELDSLHIQFSSE